MSTPRLTLSRINKALAAEFGEGAVELVKGDDYFYYSGSKASAWHTGSVLVPRLNDCTFEYWIQEARNREAEHTKYN